MNVHGRAVKTDVRAKRGKYLSHKPDVAQVRNAVDDARFLCEQCGGHQRQHRVFCSADRDLAVERLAPFDHQTIHLTSAKQNCQNCNAEVANRASRCGELRTTKASVDLPDLAGDELVHYSDSVIRVEETKNDVRV